MKKTAVESLAYTGPTNIIRLIDLEGEDSTGLSDDNINKHLEHEFFFRPRQERVT